MEEKLILLVEDNPDDQALTLRALKKNNIKNRVVIRQDGAEALDFLFCQGADADRDPGDLAAERIPDQRHPGRQRRTAAAIPWCCDGRVTGKEIRAPGLPATSPAVQPDAPMVTGPNLCAAS